MTSSNRIIEWWARNPVAANLLMVGMIAIGLLSMNSIGRETFPTVPFNYYQVNASWPGASPVELERQVLLKWEAAIKDLDDVESTRGSASQGNANLIIEASVDVDGSDFLQRLKAKIDSTSDIPSGVERVTVEQFFSRNELIRVGVHGHVSEKTLNRVARTLRDDMLLLPAVNIVERFGSRDEQIDVEVSEAALRRFGLSFAQIAQAIRNSSIDFGAGGISTQGGEISIGVRELADNAQRIGDIVIRATPDGGALRVRDVATVVDGFEDTEILASINGEPAILVQVMTTETIDVVDTSDQVTKFVDESQAKMPEGITLTIWDDQSKIYKDRVATVSNNAIGGLILVVIVLMIFLRPLVAIWAAVGIGVAFVGALGVLPHLDITLNILSLFAFLLMIGIVVDDAIIVGEAIHRANERGASGIDAAVEGASLVVKPVIFAVITTAMAFMPWLLLSGPQVNFTKNISIVVIAALAFSLIEAFLVLPAHLSGIKRIPYERASLRARIAGSLRTLAVGPYQRAVTFALKHRYITLITSACVFALAVAAIATGHLRGGFSPEVESEQVFINASMTNGNPFSRSLEVLDHMQRAEEKLKAESEERFGTEVVRHFYTRARPDSVIAIVQLQPPEIRGNVSAKEVADALRELVGDVPEAERVQVAYTLTDNGPSVEWSLSSNDSDQLTAAARDLTERLRQYDQLWGVFNDASTGKRELQVRLKPGAERYGVTLADVGRQARQAYFGEEVQRLPRDGEDVRVMVRYPKAARETMDSVHQFRVRTPSGQEVPMSVIADVEFATSVTSINRRSGYRSVDVGAWANDEDIQAVREDLKETFFPELERRYPGVTLGDIGRGEGQAEFVNEIMGLSIIMLLAQYALLAVAFASYALPAIIMVAIPFAFVGAVAGHLIWGISVMSVFSYIGVAAAAGVVVNDNLVLVDYLLRLRRERGLPVIQAVVTAAVSRFRPIVLTSITTIIGLLPLMMERSTQAQFLKPAITSLAFGVAFCSLVTLFLVPCLFAVGVDAKQAFRRWTRGTLVLTGLKRPQPVSEPAVRQAEATERATT